MRTVAIVNQKGGCGKTTVSINLAAALAGLGKKVLLVDMDPQSHCAVGLAVPEEQIEQSIYDVLISRSRNEPLRLSEILWQIGEKLELAPASIDLSAFEQQMQGINDRECCLLHVLEEVKDDYDWAVVDCPPAVSLLTFNALRASTDVLVPVETGYFALHGLSKQLETLSILCKRCQQQVSVRVLASMYDIRTKMAREILAELRSHFADCMFKTVVNFNTRLKEAASFGQPISEYDPASKGQQDFRSLAQELVGSEERPQAKSKRLVDSLADQLESIGASANELLKITKPPIPIESIRTPEAARGEGAAVLREATPAAAADEDCPAEQATAELAVDGAGEQDCRAEESTVEAADDPVETATGAVARAGTAAEPRAEAGKAAGPQVTARKAREPQAPAPRATEPRVTPGRPAEAQVTAGTATESAAAAAGRLDAKLSDYYGVSQLRDAVVFVTLYPRAGSVQIAGDFNNWQPASTPMERVGDSGVWQAQMNLPRGLYRYRLVVDGQWQQDPYNERTELNPYGELNSVLEVK